LLFHCKYRQAIIEQLVGLFGGDAQHPVAIVTKDWGTEHWSRGCYLGIGNTGVISEFGNGAFLTTLFCLKSICTALRAPCGRIHWAGTETAHSWIGYMEGALESGIRAASEVKARLAEAQTSRTAQVTACL
jgi:monoamine oxidase